MEADNYWVAIKTSDRNKLVILEVNNAKDYTEVVSWRYAGERQLKELKRQTNGEDDQLLILTSKEAAEGLSTLPDSSLSDGKDKKSSEETNGKTEKIEDTGEKIGGARKGRTEEDTGTTVLYDISGQEYGLGDSETNRAATEAVTSLLRDAGVEVEMVSAGT